MGDIAQILGVTPNSSSLHRNDDTDVPSFTTTKKLPRAVKLQRLPKDVLDLVAGGSSNNETSLDLPTAVPAIKVFPTNEKRTLTNTASATAGMNTPGDTVVKVGNKWISTNKPVRSWRWAPFTSSARNDGLVLHHWVRNNVEYLDYPYARFNIHLDAVSYDTHNDATNNMNEYRALQLHTDPNWSKSETDLLLELVKRYELRWAVIYDRWIEMFGGNNKNDIDNSYSGSRFQIEDLQHRYYTVAALINQSRITTEADYEARSLALQTNAASAALANTATITPSGSNPKVMNHPAASQSATEGATPTADTTEATNNNTNDAENEMMKQRAVETLLIETAAARALATTEPQYQPLIQNIGSGTSNKVAFDLHKERERRLQMEALWNRSKAEESEEIELRKELKQIEVQLRKLKKSGAHIAAASAATTSMNTAPTTQSSSRASTPIQFGGSGGGGVLKEAALPVDPTTLPTILDHAFATTTTAGPIAMAGTPYLQSCRLLPPGIGDGATINHALLSRMDTVLDELNIPQNPIPTKRVCDVYDTLRKDILTLLILQKEVLQKDGILSTKHLHLAKKSGNTHVDDEETLLGIPPPKPPTPTLRAPSSTTAAAASGGNGKGSRNSKAGKVDGPKKRANATPKAGSVATGDVKKDDGTGGPNNPGKATSGGKQPRKPTAPGTKRKRKSDDGAPKAVVNNLSVQTGSATGVAGVGTLPLPVSGTATATIRPGTVTNATAIDASSTTTGAIASAASILNAESSSAVAAASISAAATSTPTDLKASAKKRVKKSNT